MAAPMGVLDFDWYRSPYTTYAPYTPAYDEEMRRLREYYDKYIKGLWTTSLLYTEPKKETTEMNIITKTKFVCESVNSHFDSKGYSRNIAVEQDGTTYLVSLGEQQIKLPSKEALKDLHALVQHMLLVGV